MTEEIPQKHNPDDKPKRLLSLDTLRGFDMFWIIGGERLFRALSKATDWKWADTWAAQLHHVRWDGFKAYDLIFPLFLFLAGVSIPFAITGKLEKGTSKKSLYMKIIRRTLLLILIGLIYNGMLKFDWKNLRCASVLGRIALGYCGAALIVMNFNIRRQGIWAAGLVLAYWAAMMLLAVPGFKGGDFSMHGSLVGHVDRAFMPGQLLYRGIHDPEGLLSVIPSISTCLLGVLAGHCLRNRALSEYKKVLILAGSGLLCLLLAKLWSPWNPVNKNLWTGSFVLISGGWSLLLLSLFYLVIDVWRFKHWTLPFMVIGMNPITIYLLAHKFVNFSLIRDNIFSGCYKLFSKPWLPVFQAGMLVLVEIIFLYFLYRKKTF